MREIRLLISWLLLLSSAAVAFTGLLADWWGLSHVRIHLWSGYMAIVAGLAHLALNWQNLFRMPRPIIRREKRTPQPNLRKGVTMRGRRSFLRGIGLGLVGGLVTAYLLPLLFSIRPRVEDLSQAYHKWSSITLRGVLWSGLRWGRAPAQYKRYPSAKQIALPSPIPLTMSVQEALDRRRSVRDYRPVPITLAQLSALLHAAQGITEPTYPKRTAPSAGALYPLETYVVVHQVEDLEPGIYHYAVLDHALELISPGDKRREITLACLDQEHAHAANVVFVLSAIFQRERWKYQGRAYRYILMEAGHVGQNIYLAATALGLGACAIGAFYDDHLNTMLGIDGEEEAALYVLTVGVPA